MEGLGDLGKYNSFSKSETLPKLENGEYRCDAVVGIQQYTTTGIISTGYRVVRCNEVMQDVAPWIKNWRLHPMIIAGEEYGVFKCCSCHAVKFVPIECTHKENEDKETSK